MLVFELGSGIVGRNYSKVGTRLEYWSWNKFSDISCNTVLRGSRNRSPHPLRGWGWGPSGPHWHPHPACSNFNETPADTDDDDWADFIKSSVRPFFLDKFLALNFFFTALVASCLDQLLLLWQLSCFHWFRSCFNFSSPVAELRLVSEFSLTDKLRRWYW